MSLLLIKSYSFTLFFTLLLTSPPSVVSRTSSPATKTTHNIQTFMSARRGSKIKGISQIKRYLSRFGYLPIMQNNNNTSFTDEFDAEFESSLIKYQQKLALQVTGKLDPNTVSQMITPRCGVQDTPHNHKHFTKHFVYFPGKPTWSRDSSRATPMTLTYAFSPDHMIHSLSLSEIREAFRKAFSRWGSVIPVSFVEAEDYGYADIKIGFYDGDHGDGEPFDGVLGVLAHSFSPESGRLHLDAAETWAVDFGVSKSEVAVDLESVATHEIGHLLGLSHSSVKEAVMYPSLRPRDKRADLDVDDIKGVQSLYGSNPHFRSDQWSLESDMSANQGVVLFGGKKHLRSLVTYFMVMFYLVQIF